MSTLNYEQNNFFTKADLSTEEVITDTCLLISSVVKSFVGFILHEEILKETTTETTMQPQQLEEIVAKLFGITLSTGETKTFTTTSTTRMEMTTIITKIEIISPITKSETSIEDSVIENLSIQNLSLKTIICLLSSLLFCIGKMEINIILQNMLQNLK